MSSRTGCKPKFPLRVLYLIVCRSRACLLHLLSVFCRGQREHSKRFHSVFAALHFAFYFPSLRSWRVSSAFFETSARFLSQTILSGPFPFRPGLCNLYERYSLKVCMLFRVSCEMAYKTRVVAVRCTKHRFGDP